ncbi:aromatic-ring-hydroxylating dioxygenase subunit beta [Streptomyces sp. NPDC050560]|uniref:aromatic-ring-hydroxylating dioxygenase subunit beta n=1 Tax=Streptomyces sp. NPDC050560 TaxID=3365630 RepID=UPI003788688C
MTAHARTGAPPLDRAAAEDLLFEEAARLDDGDFTGWLDLFTDDAVYWLPARRGEFDPGRHVSLIHDDRLRMEERVWRLTNGPAHAQIPPSATRRLIANVRVARDPARDPALAVVTSNFSLHESRNDQLRTFAGQYEHRLRHTADGGWLISRKKALLVNCDAPLFNLTFLV